MRFLKNKLGEQYIFSPPHTLSRVEPSNSAYTFEFQPDLERDIKWPLPRRQVDQVQMKLTNQCNFECRHCIEGSGRGQKGFLDFSRWRSFLADFFNHNSEGTVVLTGGEPLLHPDIDIIIEELLSLGLRIRLFTNGALLAAGRLSQEMLACLDLVQLSLDGFTEEVNDHIRGVGAFDATIEALAVCEKANVPVRISCVLCKQNIEDIKANCEQFFVRHCGGNVSLNFGRLEQKGRGAEFWSGEECGLNNQAVIRAAFSPPPETQEIDAPKLCGYGNALSIDHRGNIYACSSNLARLSEGESFRDILIALNSNWDRLYDRASKICRRCTLGWVCKAGCFLENEDSCDELRMNRTTLRLKYGFLE